MTTATASTNGQLPKDVRGAAAYYRNLGVLPIPVYSRSKIPIGEEWEQQRPTLGDIDSLFPESEPRNVGLLLGSPSKNLTDTDLDCAEAIAAAPYLLPKTGWISGRPSARRSHYWNTTDDPPDAASTSFCDVDETKLLELRSTRGQTVVPPSIHEEGEPISWDVFDEPAHVPIKELKAAVRALAAATILARHWPGPDSHRRQDAALCLCGGLGRAGWNVEQVECFLTAVATAAGDDEVRQRLTAVVGTLEKIQAGEKVRGWPSLAKIIGSDVITRACGWLGIVAQPKKKSSGAAADGKPSAATLLVGLVEEAGVELFHTPDEIPCASLPVGQHLETCSIKSKVFRRYLSRLYYTSLQKAVGAQALQSAIGVLEGKAVFDGAEIPVHVRVAEHAGRIYLDLADDAWRAVEVSAEGWQIVERPPVRFIRPRGVLELPEPMRGGKVEELRRFVNVRREDDFKLLVAWLAQAFRARGPYPILTKTGEQGSAKSTLGRVLRLLIDPNKAALRTEPRDERDLAIAATNGWVVAFDNLSTMPPWLSDALCRLSTGGGFATRELYTDAEEAIFDFQRPALLTSIEDVVTRGDALDRTIFLELEPIPDERRLPEKELWAAFLDVRPRILGALLDGVAAGLKHLPDVRFDRLPRMADFALWAEACGRGLGWKPGEFLKAYAGNRVDANDLALDASPVAGAVRQLMVDLPIWEGTASELLQQLNAQLPEKKPVPKGWPARPHNLSGALKRLAPNFRRSGIAVEFCREAGTGRRGIELKKECAAASQASRASQGQGAGDANLNVDTGSDEDAGGGSGEARRHSSVTPASHPSGPSAACDAAGVPCDAAVTVNVPAEDSSNPLAEEDLGKCVTLRDACDAAAPLSSAGYTVVRAESELATVLQALAGGGRVGLDIETTGLNPHTDRLRLLSLATSRGVFLVDCFAVDPRPLFERLADKTLVGHNLYFDLGFLAVRGFEPGPVSDTVLLSRLLYGTHQPRGFHELRHCVQRELGQSLDKSKQRSCWTGTLDRAQLDYAATDAAVTLPLREALDAKVCEAELLDVADIESRCLPAMVWLARSGVGVSRDGWLAISVGADAEAQRLAAALDARAPAPDQPGFFSGWNWDSPEQVKEVFHRLGVELVKTDDETLAAVEHPLADLLRQYRAARKGSTTYGPEWLKHVAADGRVYASWNQLGSDAGRMSCSRPNLQQLPRGAHRRCIQAPLDRVLVKADYSQIELRIAAEIAGEKAMLDAYARGEDLHQLTAQRVLGIADVTKQQRQLAKAVNFGLLYGMRAKGFRKYARSQYGLELTEQEAWNYRRAFFKSYPGLAAWHQRVEREHASETRTLAGRRRLIAEDWSDTLRLNSPVQGTGADGLKLALAFLWERREECPGAFPVLAVHDEIVVECAAEQAEAASGWLRHAMLDGMQPWLKTVPVEVDVHVGRTWGGD